MPTAATFAVVHAATAGNAAVASANAARAHAAYVAQCEAFMPTFSGATASPQAARAYAGCVGAVYPQSAGADVRLLFTIAGVTLIACMLAGAFLGSRDGYMGTLEGVLVGVLAWLGGVAFILLVAFLIAGATGRLS